jgi:hypothetical protein
MSHTVGVTQHWIRIEQWQTGRDRYSLPAMPIGRPFDECVLHRGWPTANRRSCIHGDSVGSRPHRKSGVFELKTSIVRSTDSESDSESDFELRA